MIRQRLYQVQPKLLIVATVHYVTAIPKGKIYDQLVLERVAGVVARYGSESAQLAPYKLRTCRVNKRVLEAVIRGAPPRDQQLPEW